MPSNRRVQPTDEDENSILSMMNDDENFVDVTDMLDAMSITSEEFFRGMMRLTPEPSDGNIFANVEAWRSTLSEFDAESDGPQDEHAPRELLVDEVEMAQARRRRLGGSLQFEGEAGEASNAINEGITGPVPEEEEEEQEEQELIEKENANQSNNEGNEYQLHITIQAVMNLDDNNDSTTDN